MFTYLKTAGLAAVLLASQGAYAAVFSYTDLNASNGGPIGDQLSSISSTYNDVTSQFTWDVSFNAGTAVDGFWLVVNNGSNPKASNANELAIMYGDLSTGILSTYTYNGANNANSINTPGILLQTDTFQVGTDSFKIDIDASGINNGAHTWSTPTAGDINGIGFDDNFGGWFHLATGSDFGYTGGDITEFSHQFQGWYDVANKETTQVPEPGSIALLALGLAGLMAGRRRKA